MFQNTRKILRSILIRALGRQPSKGTGTVFAEPVPSAPGQFNLRDANSGGVSDLLVFKICAPVLPPELVQNLQLHRVTVHLMRRSSHSSGEELNHWVEGQRQGTVAAPFVTAMAQQRAVLLHREPNHERGPLRYRLSRDVQHFLLVHRETAGPTFPEIAQRVQMLLAAHRLQPEPASVAEVNEILDTASDQKGFFGACYEVDMGSGMASGTLQSVWEQGEPEHPGVCWNWVSLVEVNSGNYVDALKEGMRHRGSPPSKEVLVKIAQSSGELLLYVRAGGCAPAAFIGDTTAIEWEAQGLRTERTKGSTFLDPGRGHLGFWTPYKSLFSLLYSEERPLGRLQPTAIPLATLNRTIVGFDPLKPLKSMGGYCNTTLIGGGGSGKTHIAKDVIRACIARGDRVRVIGRAGEYEKFCELFEGAYVKLGQAGAGLNLLSLVPAEGPEGYLMRQLTAWIIDMVEQVEPIQHFDEMLIQRALEKTWDRMGTNWTLQDVSEEFAVVQPERGSELAKALGNFLSDKEVAALFTTNPATASAPVVGYEPPPHLSPEIQAIAGSTALLVEQIRTRELLQMGAKSTLMVVDDDCTMSVPLRTARRALREARAMHAGLFICVSTEMAISKDFVELVDPCTRHIIFLGSGGYFYSEKLPLAYRLSEVQAMQLSGLPHPNHPATALIIDRDSEQSSVVQWCLSGLELRLASGDLNKWKEWVRASSSPR